MLQAGNGESRDVLFLSILSGALECAQYAQSFLTVCFLYHLTATITSQRARPIMPSVVLSKQEQVFILNHHLFRPTLILFSVPHLSTARKRKKKKKAFYLARAVLFLSTEACVVFAQAGDVIMLHPRVGYTCINNAPQACQATPAQLQIRVSCVQEPGDVPVRVHGRYAAAVRLA